MADPSSSISNSTLSSDNLLPNEEEDWKCPMCSGMESIDEETFWEEILKCPDCEKFSRYHYMAEEETELDNNRTQNIVIFIFNLNVNNIVKFRMISKYCKMELLKSYKTINKMILWK